MRVGRKQRKKKTATNPIGGGKTAKSKRWREDTHTQKKQHAHSRTLRCKKRDKKRRRDGGIEQIERLS